MADKIAEHMKLVDKVGRLQLSGGHDKWIKAREAVEASARALAQGEPGEACTNRYGCKCPLHYQMPTASAPAAPSHDYPACAIFRGGKCTCDQNSGAQR